MKGKKGYAVVRIFVMNSFDESYVESVWEKIRCAPDELDSVLEKMPVRRNPYSKLSSKGRQRYWEICTEIIVLKGNQVIKRIKPEIDDHE